MAKCILELNNVQISFGDRLLLDLDRLAVYDGERIGLIGENGAGKTTLLRVLSGELTPDAGQVRRLAPVAMIRQQGDADAGSDAEIRARFQAQETREGLSGGEMTRRAVGPGRPAAGGRTHNGPGPGRPGYAAQKSVRFPRRRTPGLP